MKTAFFSNPFRIFKRTLNISLIIAALCLMSTACGQQRYYLPGGGRNASGGGGCGCPAFSTLPPTEHPAAAERPTAYPAAPSAGTPTSANA